MSFSQYKRVLGSGTSYLSTTDLFVEIDTILGVATIYLPKISELFNSSATNNIYNFNGIRFTDLSNNAAINNIIFKGKDGDLVNGLSEIVLDTNGVGGVLTPIGETGWSLTINNIATSSGGTIGGGGTLNYLSKFSPDGLNIANSLIFDDGTSVGIGTNTPDASALLDLNSTTQGFAAPRMTTLQRDAIVAPIVSLLIFNTSSGFYNYWDGSAWVQMDTSTGGDVSGSGTTNYATMWTDGANSVIGDGTWYFSGNDYLPVTTGSNIGDDTHRIGTIFMASVFDYANDLNFYNGTSNTMTLTTGGNLGIGTISPTEKLNVFGTVRTDFTATGYTPAFTIFNNGGAAAEFGYNTNYGAVLNANQGILALNPVSGNVGIGTTFSNAKLSFGGFYNATANPTSNQQTSHIKLYEDVGNSYYGFGMSYDTKAVLTIAANSSVGQLGFYTNSLQRALIDENGNVGIGTSSPTSKLHVNGSVLATDLNVGGVDSSYAITAISKLTGLMRMINTSFQDMLNVTDSNFWSYNLNSLRIGFGSVASSTARIFIPAYDNNINNYSLYITNNAQTIPYLAVQNDGNIGIGRNPVAKLDILGSDDLNTTYSFLVQPLSFDRNFYITNRGYVNVAGSMNLNLLANGSTTRGFNITNGSDNIMNVEMGNGYLYFGNSKNVFSPDGHIGFTNGLGTSSIVKLWVAGDDSTSANYAFWIQDSFASPLFKVRNDGVDEAYFHSTGKIYMGTSNIGKSSGSNGININARGDADWTFGWNNGEIRASGTFDGGKSMDILSNSSSNFQRMQVSGSKYWDYGTITDNFTIRGVLNADPSYTDILTILQTSGHIKTRAVNAVLADGSLNNSEMTSYIDEGTDSLIFKVKYSTGVVKTVTLPLI